MGIPGFSEMGQGPDTQDKKNHYCSIQRRPQIIEIRKDLFVLFGEEDADWKGTLLRIHDSQQQRSIHSRGMGFDERILSMNHLSWKRLHEISTPAVSSARYTEVFEIELFDFTFPEG